MITRIDYAEDVRFGTVRHASLSRPDCYIDARWQVERWTTGEKIKRRTILKDMREAQQMARRWVETGE